MFDLIRVHHGARTKETKGNQINTPLFRLGWLGFRSIVLLAVDLRGQEGRGSRGETTSGQGRARDRFI